MIIQYHMIIQHNVSFETHWAPSSSRRTNPHQGHADGNLTTTFSITILYTEMTR